MNNIKLLIGWKIDKPDPRDHRFTIPLHLDQTSFFLVIDAIKD